MEDLGSCWSFLFSLEISEDVRLIFRRLWKMLEDVLKILGRFLGDVHFFLEKILDGFWKHKIRCDALSKRKLDICSGGFLVGFGSTTLDTTLSFAAIKNTKISIENL